MLVSDSEEEIVAYYPSSYGEKNPHHNKRISLMDRMGSTVVGWIEGYEKKQDAPPAWLVEKYENENRIQDAIYPASGTRGPGKE